MVEKIILVDEQDQVLGYEEKLEVHKQKVLHRAFSLFIYDENAQKLLIHQRAFGKYHSEGLWTNSCCSHPREGEDILEAVIRRTKQELGIMIPDEEHCKLKEVGLFKYFKDFGELAEHEMDHVFIWKYDMNKIDLDIDANEINDYKWITLSELETWMDEHIDDFTAWFPLAYIYFRKNI